MTYPIWRDPSQAAPGAGCLQRRHFAPARGERTHGLHREPRRPLRRRAGRERHLLACAGEGGSPSATPVVDAIPARPAVVSCCATEHEAAELMRVHHTRHLAVVEGGEIVGIFSLLDLVTLVVEEKQWSIDLLEGYIRGGRAAQLSTPIRPAFDRTPDPAPAVLS
jgi:hypothetical protein